MPEGLAALTPEELGPTVFAKLAERCAQAFNARLDRWRDALQRDLDHIRRPADVAGALQSARNRARALEALSGSPLLYPQLAEALANALTRMLAAAHDAIEQSARGQGRAGEELLRTLRAAGIAKPIEVELDAAAPSVASPTHRIVIL